VTRRGCGAVLSSATPFGDHGVSQGDDAGVRSGRQLMLPLWLFHAEFVEFGGSKCRKWGCPAVLSQCSRWHPEAFFHVVLDDRRWSSIEAPDTVRPEVEEWARFKADRISWGSSVPHVGGWGSCHSIRDSRGVQDPNSSKASLSRVPMAPP
jgi:hypothetical protein